MKVVIEHGEYKGSPVVTIRYDTEEYDRYPFSFGVGKAKRIIQALKQDPDFLEKFVMENAQENNCG